MKKQEELNNKEFQDDMTELKELLEQEGIEHTFGRHEGADPQVKTLIGYYPTGEWHIRVGSISIIRGMASFGYYELMDIKDSDPERFETAQEVLKEIKNRTKK
uniref:Uncharacterized protein n=1 Tax=viral metagenome TaxID=1070528 RepID=A0A6H1ZJQ7_9ZZZZ